jgi:hypothetical protein
MYRAIANESKNSKLREQMPEAFKNYVNAVIAEHGNVEEAKAPAEKLTSLLQKEGSRMSSSRSGCRSCQATEGRRAEG